MAVHGARGRCGIGRLWYDHNLLNLQPVGLESVELERKLLTESNQSIWYAVSIADSREELLARKAKFLELKSVERTEEIVSLLPADHEVKQPIIERIQKAAGWVARASAVDSGRPARRFGPRAGQGAGPGDHQPAGREARNLEQVRDMLRRMPLSDCYALLSQFQQQMAGDLLSRLYALRTMANPDPPKLTDLPESLVHRFVGQHDKHLLKIYGRGNIWDMDSRWRSSSRTCAASTRSVTGNPLQAYEASLEMKSSYEDAALYALVIILGLLWFDFRNMRHALLAALPLGVGVLQMFGLMGMLDIPLNPANMIALPLILGISVD